MAHLNAGEILVALTDFTLYPGTNTCRILHLNRDGTLIDTHPIVSSGGAFAVSVIGIGDVLYVLLWDDVDHIVAIDTSTDVQTEFYTFTDASLNGSMVLDGAGNFLVLHPSTNEVYQIDPGGALINTFTVDMGDRFASGGGISNFANAMAIDPLGGCIVYLLADDLPGGGGVGTDVHYVRMYDLCDGFAPLGDLYTQSHGPDVAWFYWAIGVNSLGQPHIAYHNTVAGESQYMSLLDPTTGAITHTYVNSADPVAPQVRALWIDANNNAIWMTGGEPVTQLAAVWKINRAMNTFASYLVANPDTEQLYGIYVLPGGVDEMPPVSTARLRVSVSSIN